MTQVSISFLYQTTNALAEDTGLLRFNIYLTSIFFALNDFNTSLANVFAYICYVFLYI